MAREPLPLMQVEGSGHAAPTTGVCTVSRTAKGTERRRTNVMTPRPLDLTLELRPRSRYDVIDVAHRVVDTVGDVLSSYRRVLYCSLHTTAGYLDQRIQRRLEHRRDRLDPYMHAYQTLFPPDAGYSHDALHLRRELSDEQRLVEPRNADAHLAFIGSGLRNCVTYEHLSGEPVYFMDLDGVCDGRARERRTSLIAYTDEEVVASVPFEIPVSRHVIDSVNLSDPRVGLVDRVQSLLAANPVEHGRIDISLDGAEEFAAVTVNEYETLLMRHDLAEVLRNPLRFMARQGRNMLRDPMAIPTKSLGYAKYDAVQVINELIDALGLSESLLERIVAKVMALPAARVLRFKRSLSMPVIRPSGGGAPDLVRGQYQSPILIQWRPSSRQARTLRVSLTRFS